MLIFLALLYFCAACTLIWLAFFPAARASVMQRMAAAASHVARNACQAGGRAARSAGALRRALRGCAGGAAGFVRRHLAACAVGVPLVLVPSLLAMVLGRRDILPGYDDPGIVPDPQVAALLKGEQLVAPAALPPLAFSTPEVQLVRPLLGDASRNWGLLHPEFGQRLLLVFRIMQEKYGYQMALLEGYRSPARQDLLARLGSQVTNARAFQSWHQYGLAADCAFWRDGRLVISEKDPWAMRGYQLYGQVAESAGLGWGGRWTTMDLGHVELRLRGMMRR